MNQLANLRAATEAILEEKRAEQITADQRRQVREALLTAEVLLRVWSEFAVGANQDEADDHPAAFLRAGNLPLLMRMHADAIVAILEKVPL